MTQLSRQQRHLRSEREMLKEQELLHQYRTCIDALNELFEIAPDECYQQEAGSGPEGIGSCDISYQLAQSDLWGPAADTIESMQWYLADRSKIEEHGACPFHQQNLGCVVNNIKSPTCAGAYSQGLLEKTSYNPFDMRSRLREVLLCGEEKVWGGAPHYLDLDWGDFDVKGNWDRVNELLGIVDEVKQQALQLKNRRQRKEAGDNNGRFS